MLEFILWTILIYGIQIIVIDSDLFDWYRDLFFGRSKSMKIDSHGAIRLELRNPYSWFMKLISCFICVSFWSGLGLSFLSLGPSNNPLINAIVAVGVISLLKIVTEKRKGA